MQSNGKAAAEQPTEAAPVSEEAAEPQAEETAAEETLDEPRNEMDELADVVREQVAEVYVIGDASRTSNALDAIAAGADIGKRI